jgi:hypothetical protein
MRAIDQIPPSQRSRVRFVARQAWIECVGDFDNAAVLVDMRMGREVGGAWVLSACQVAKTFLVHWSQNGVSEPAAVPVSGEPFTTFEDDET